MTWMHGVLAFAAPKETEKETEQTNTEQEETETMYNIEVEIHGPAFSVQSGPPGSA